MVKGTKTGTKKAATKKDATKKAVAKKVEEQPVVEEQLPETLPQDEGDSSEDEVGLEGFSSEDEQEPEVEAHQVKKLASKKSDKAAEKSKSGIIYIGRLPEGFYEKELNKYFSQFGEIKQAKLARNKKTGNSRHYGYVEFASMDDAKVAQDTMNNYLVLGHQLKVAVLESDAELKNLKKYKRKPVRVTKVTKTTEQLKENSKKKQQERKDQLKKLGFELEL